VAKNRVVVANMRGDLVILNLTDGKLVWKYELGGQIISNPAVVEGKLIVGNFDGFIYCFGN
jgi:outer membrane protein assembly factor BamB